MNAAMPQEVPIDGSNPSRVSERPQFHKHSEVSEPCRCSTSIFRRYGCHLCSPALRAKAALIEWVEDFFENFGYSVFDHPWKYIIIPTVICLVFSLGFIWRTPELDMEVLYSLPNTPSATAKRELNQVFPLERITYVFAVSDNPHELLSQSNLAAMDQFWTKVLNMKVPRYLVEDSIVPGDVSVMDNWFEENAPQQFQFDPNYTPASTPHRLATSKFITLDDVCIHDPKGQCQLSTPLSLYATPNQWGRPIRTNTYPQKLNMKTQNGYLIDSILGDIELQKFGETTEVLNATAGAFRVDLNGNIGPHEDSAAWEQALIAMVKKIQLPGLKLFVKTERSIQDELALSCQLRGEDLLMLIAAATFVTCFTVSMNSSRDRYRTKWLPAAVGVASTLLAFGGGVGLCHMLGLKHVPPSESTPFIILGIGVDDVFVIINAYSMTYLHSDDARTRIGLSLRDAGISVTITTVTNILAFLVGANSSYFSIYVFCLVTGVGLLVGYLLCLTVFCGALAIDAKREQQNRGISLALTAANNGKPSELPAAQLIPEKPPTPMVDSASRHSTSTITSEYSVPHYTLPAESPPRPMQVASRLPSPSFSPDNALSFSESEHVESHIGSEHVDSPTTDRFFSPNQSSRVSRALEITSVDGAWPVLDTVHDSVLDSVHEVTPAFPQQLEDGFYAVEPLDNNLVVAERVAKLGCKSLCHRKNSKKSTSFAPSNSDSCLSTPASIRVTAGMKTGHGGGRGETISIVGDTEKMARLIQVRESLIPIERIDFEEPKGSVGKLARRFFMGVYGPFLMRPTVKVIVILSFLALFCFSCYNSSKVKAGLQMKDVAPYKSYLRDFINIRETFFTAYGDECVVFFPLIENWWDPQTQKKVVELTNAIRDLPHTGYVRNGFEELLTFMDETPEFKNVTDPSAALSDDNRQDLFTKGLKAWLLTPRGATQSTMFKIDRGLLKSWKFYYWMKYMDNTRISIAWVQEAQQILERFKKDFTGHMFTPLAVMWESDPVIFQATLMNMVIALLTMAVIASLMIPDLRSGLMVLVVIVMIDINVFGFMPVWGLNLNMITMVNLVLSIGFAVDYTAHITHCFNHCKGTTKERRAVECLVLMGLPVTNGMMSTYAAVAAMSVSHKYALTVVFQMTTSVLAFAFLHGVVLMPVVLSLIGPMVPREIDVLEIKNGRVEAWTIDGRTGKALKNMSHHAEKRLHQAVTSAEASVAHAHAV